MLVKLITKDFSCDKQGPKQKKRVDPLKIIVYLMCVFFTHLMFVYSWVRNLGMLFFIARIKKVNKMSIRGVLRPLTFLASKKENNGKTQFWNFLEIRWKTFTLKR